MADGIAGRCRPPRFLMIPLPFDPALTRTKLFAEADVHSTRWRLHLSSDRSPAKIESVADLIQDVPRTVFRKRHAARLAGPAGQVRDFVEAVT